MKLLLDENLSYRIIPALQNTYPGSYQAPKPLQSTKFSTIIPVRFKKHRTIKNNHQPVSRKQGLNMAKDGLTAGVS